MLRSTLESLAMATVLVALLSGVLTGLVRRYAMARGVMDHPIGRSSHSVSMPRGGGLAIVLSFSIGILASSAKIPTDLVLALLVPGSIVAAVGLADDHGHIAARWRLLTHFCSAVGVLAWIGIPRLDVMGTTLELGAIGTVLAALFLVWMLNLYNFMDGVDGIAASEAVVVGLAGSIVGYVAGLRDVGDLAPPLILASASFGFLIWNWPPARIFMGDVGSGFLGLTIGVMSLHAATAAPVLLWAWSILLGVFVVDGTVTLLRRMFRGQRLHEAHRSHAYQHAAQIHGSHLLVSLATIGITVFWLVPWAMAVAAKYVEGIVGLSVSYAPLVWLSMRYRAGE